MGLAPSFWESVRNMNTCYRSLVTPYCTSPRAHPVFFWVKLLWFSIVLLMEGLTDVGTTSFSCWPWKARSCVYPLPPSGLETEPLAGALQGLNSDLSRSLYFFYIYIHLFIYLAALGLGCGTQDLHCIMWDISLQGKDPLVVAHGLQ